MSLQPDVLWAQRSDYIYVTIDLKDVQDMSVSLEADNVAFSGKVGGDLYKCDLKWFRPIKKEESKWSHKRLIEFCLKKETEEEWPRLREEKVKVQWIKVDWKRWQDSDDEAEAAPFDTSGMGDMNFGDMDGDEFDSDDEELPDLDPGAAVGDAGDKESPEEAKGEGPKTTQKDNELESID
eukprot:CAMPEP_0172710832 /NCGR_PEP_ID=MMETSP1074-20121228/56987_1 /TAXON_ID=2916 /ORGANISM="Ceratium fusus, Strain PA161109" /LENGTH=179 /DNA_ID=CAMNT_0013534343 /DNA_START=53 /DNA_END=592 /DNA_ORIENTATION=-